MVTRSDRHYTYADYLKFPADQRWELMDGVAYAMAPAPSTAHQDLLVELTAQVAGALRGQRCRALVATVDVRFQRSDSADNVVQPDLVVVCDPGKIDNRGIHGAPDWIVEVLSPATASRDQIGKRRLYEREGVREYWLVHPVDRVVTVYRVGDGGSFAMPEVFELKGSLEVQAVPGLSIDWDLWQPLRSAEYD